MTARAPVALTHDGRILAGPRAALREEDDILHFMAADVRALRLPPDCEDFSGLHARGWSAGQCRRHFAAALRRAHADTPARVMGELAALLFFLAGLLAGCLALAGPGA